MPLPKCNVMQCKTLLIEKGLHFHIEEENGETAFLVGVGLDTLCRGTEESSIPALERVEIACL